ncbi:MAG: hypothetical protein SFY32_02045 [Bacteroidota bacterium]|nr:hypothetical protein [Bacteroidota bacterium]
MKKALVVVMIGFVAASAQNQGFSKGDKTLSFGLNGINSITQNASPAGSLLYRIYKSETKAVRIGLNLEVSINNYAEPTQKLLYASASSNNGYLNKYTKYNSTTNRTSVMAEFTYGKQYQIFKINKFETYFYGDLGFLLRYTSNSRSNTWSDSLLENEGSVNNNSSIYNIPGDYIKSFDNDLAYGISPIIGVGFNYYLTDYITVGSEFGYGIMFTHSIIKSKIYEEKRRNYESVYGGNAILNNYELRANNFRALILFQFLICRYNSQK